jgi:hypothetical protein
MLMYGHENWALNRSEMREIETAEMRILKWCVPGCTLTDHVCNTTIRNSLQVYALKDRIQVYRNKRRKHIFMTD